MEGDACLIASCNRNGKARLAAKPNVISEGFAKVFATATRLHQFAALDETLKMRTSLSTGDGC